MKNFLLVVGMLLFTLQLNANCDQGNADFYWTTNSCGVTLIPCNSGGPGNWEFGDGNSVSFVQSATHCYSSSGTYTVKHTFILTGEVITHQVTINCDPTTFSSSVDGCCTSFEASGPDCASSSDFEWDYGDGNTGVGESTNHCYDENGTYTVTLTNGDEEVTQTVTVDDCDDDSCPIGYNLSWECGPLPWETGQPWTVDCISTYTLNTSYDYVSVYWTVTVNNSNQGLYTYTVNNQTSVSINHFFTYNWDEPWNSEYNFIREVCVTIVLSSGQEITHCGACHPLPLVEDDPNESIKDAIRAMSLKGLVYPSRVFKGREINVDLIEDFTHDDSFHGQALIIDPYGNVARTLEVNDKQFQINTRGLNAGLHTIYITNDNPRYNVTKRFIILNE